MTRGQRVSHMFIWLLIAPVLGTLLIVALAARRERAKHFESAGAPACCQIAAASVEQYP